MEIECVMTKEKIPAPNATSRTNHEELHFSTAFSEETNGPTIPTTPPCHDFTLNAN